MSNVLRRAALVGAMTGISRLAGLVREQLMAHAFGTGLAKSAFDVAFRIPNLFRRLFGEGALSAAFIPVYTETREREGPEAANQLAGRIAGLLIATLSLLTALGILLALALQWQLPADSRWSAILPLLRIMLPYAPLICLAALAMGILNALKHFAMPALAPVFLNLVWIVALVAVCPWLPNDPFIRIRVVAWAVLVAGVIQIGVQVPALRHRGVPLRPAFDWRGDARVARILRLMAPMALGAGLVQINVCVDGVLAMWAAPWGPSALEYAERLVYLPMGIVGNAFATVLLPTMSSHATAKDHAGMRETLERALRNVAVIMAPMAIGLTVLALPVVTLIYRLGNGAFQAESAIQTARALAGYAPGLLVFSLYKAITPAFYALQDTRTPMRVGVFGVVLNFSLNVLFVVTWPAGWKHMGIAVATVLTSIVNCVTLAVVLRRRIGAPRLAPFARVCGAALVAALVMGVAAVFAERAAMDYLAPRLALKLAQVLSVSGAIAVGALLYGALIRLFCPFATAELLDDLRHRKRA
ncbi:MAG: murein biosynthesis integral membrane protein MurJ [Kiritimatiellae bacterium]|nr:murein biosynthesis integral membrane protein MurJ [Kiritimatiellia bacterium]